MHAAPKEIISHGAGQVVRACCILLLVATCNQHTCPTLMGVFSLCMARSPWTPKYVLMLWCCAVRHVQQLQSHEAFHRGEGRKQVLGAC